MHPHGSGRAPRTSSGHPNGQSNLNDLLNPYTDWQPTRPAPPPPTSRPSGHRRQNSSSAAYHNGVPGLAHAPQRDPFARRGSLGMPSGLSGLSATRPSGFSTLDLDLPPLTLPPASLSGRGPRLGSGELGSGLALASALDDTPTLGLPPLSTIGTGPRSRRRRGVGGAGGGIGTGTSGIGSGLDSGLSGLGGLPPLGTLGSPLNDSQPSLYSQSQPLDIEPTVLAPNDWRRTRGPVTHLENPVNRETRREARHRTIRDWEEDGELRE